MRLSADRLDRYAVALATYLWSVGIDLDQDIPRLREADDGRLEVVVGGDLPGSGGPGRSRIELAEQWAPRGDVFEQVAYRYEVIDHFAHRRRAFHRHDDAAFVRAFGVLVHEHCEEPIGVTACEHVAGLPKRDGFEAMNDLLVAWSTPADILICVDLPCLE